MATMRLRTKVRKLINALGIDAHRYIRQPGKLDFLKQYDIKTVLDIGANVGQSALEFRAILPLAYIYSFEPLPDCLKNSRVQCERRTLQSVPFALGVTAGDIWRVCTASSSGNGQIHKEYSMRRVSKTNGSTKTNIATGLRSPEILSRWT